MKKVVKQDEVTDEQGRRRFHGAFTGGFSAGYYNTVGSAEGFQPQQFVSSRGNRTAAAGQDVRCFMDEDDDGLLGRGLTSTKGFDTFGVRGEGVTKRAADDMARSSSIPGPAPTELLVAPTTSIGKTLLMSMGWRQGQGIGGRVARPELGFAGADSGGTISVSAIARRVAEGGVTFAPRNTSELVKMPPPKADFRGIGCNESGLRELLLRSAATGAKRKVWKMNSVFGKGGDGDGGSSSSGGGDSDDDVYGSSLRSSSKHRVEEVVLSEDDDEPATGPGHARSAATVAASIDSWVDGSGAAPSGQKCPSDGRFVLSGFVLASSVTGAQQRATFFPLPAIPKDFRPCKVFAPAPLEGGKDAVRGGGAAARGVLLGESTITKLIPPPPPLPPPPLPPPPPPPSADSRPLLISEATANALQSKLGLGWTGLSEAFKNRFVASGAAPVAPVAPADAEGPAKRVNRTTFLWSPAPLLCKRLNIASVPSTAAPISAAVAASSSRVDTIFDQHIGSFLVAGAGSGSGSGGSAAAPSVLQKAAAEDPLVSLEQELLDFKNRPDISVFKAIFESDVGDLGGGTSKREKKPMPGLSFADDDEGGVAVVLPKHESSAAQGPVVEQGGAGRLVAFADRKRVRNHIRSVLSSNSSDSDVPGKESSDKRHEEEDDGRRKKQSSRWDK